MTPEEIAKKIWNEWDGRSNRGKSNFEILIIEALKTYGLHKEKVIRAELEGECTAVHEADSLEIRKLQEENQAVFNRGVEAMREAAAKECEFHRAFIGCNNLPKAIRTLKIEEEK